MRFATRRSGVGRHPGHLVGVLITGLISATMLLVAPGGGGAQVTRVIPDLADVATSNGWTLFNRGAEQRGAGVYLDARPGLGVAWFDGIRLTEGALEVTLQGKDVPQASFLGVAFRGVDDETFEAVYFRPFNFQASDPTAQGHSVQYVAHPQYTWQRLRQQSPGEYEAALQPAPDPEGPFKARIEFGNGKVRVFVNGASTPCLEVTALGTGAAGRIGLWVGNNSDGQFSALTIFVP